MSRQFNYLNNTLLEATLTDKRDKSIQPQLSQQSWPAGSSLNSLSTISALYVYTNPPPMGYGTPAPKVAESVIRAMKYNLNPRDLRQRDIDGYKVNVPYWVGAPDNFPFEETHRNFHVGEAHRMFRATLRENHWPIITSTRATMSHLMNTNASVLTKGRQTWNPFLQQSFPSGQAFNNMADFFKVNTDQVAFTCLEWMQGFFTCCNAPLLKHMST